VLVWACLLRWGVGVGVLVLWGWRAGGCCACVFLFSFMCWFVGTSDTILFACVFLSLTWIFKIHVVLLLWFCLGLCVWIFDASFVWLSVLVYFCHVVGLF